jgi:1,4-alpha-glucan branching enzyme
MPGDAWQKFASLRLLYTFMFTYPGKKLLFMGNEFAHGREWSEAEVLDWWLLERSEHRTVQTLVRELNHLYKTLPALHEQDFEYMGFSWIDCHDASQSVLSYRRIARDGTVALVVLNFTPVPRQGYRIGVPMPGFYRETLNSDSEYYGGSNVGNSGGMAADPVPWMGQEQSISLTIPPLAGVILTWEP